ncbi:hypothetical protein [Streptomyces sp. NPDC013455]|uniref:hypothetical protein n=1 Tax=Streptomyces sp. NPDC013455 TaxID=3155605 RepID=UPI0033E1C347
MHTATVDHADPPAPAELARSLEVTGCGVLAGHPPARTGLVEQIRRERAGFLACATEWKYRNSGGRKGFFPLPADSGPDAPELDRKEFAQIPRGGKYPEEVPDSAPRYSEEAGRLAATVPGRLGDRAAGTSPHGGHAPVRA